MPGTYTGPKNTQLEISDKLKNVTIYSRNVDTTIIDLQKGCSFIKSSPFALTIIGLQIIDGFTAFDVLSGGIYATGPLTIRGCKFYGMHSNLNGGAIYHDGNVPLIIENTDFTEGTARTGGSIYAKHSILTMNNVKAWNHVADNGGFAFLEGAQLTAKNIELTNNRARNAGGSFYLRRGTKPLGVGVIENSSFANNRGTNIGGAIYLNVGTSIRTVNCVFHNNSAFNGHGGAVFGTQIAYYDLSSQFRYNSANSRGGAFYADSSTVNMYNTKFEYNIGYSGGGVFIDTQTKMNLNGVSFMYNTGIDGGALNLANQCVINTNTTTIEQNKGGGIFCSNSNLNLNSDSVIEDNKGSNIVCSDFPSFTYCKINGNSKWTNYCKSPSASKSGISDDARVWVIIAFSALSALLFVVLLGALFVIITNRRKKAKEAKEWDPIKMKDEDSLIKTEAKKNIG